ncbi:MAG: hypothetical protein HY873_03150 [Chloroflexi bacterium]|nr:hypothetical protein [Chloroflexota bacterium]
MTTETTPGAIVEQNGVLIGPYRAPRNLAQTQRGSIHDDAMATKLGFRGGTVAGSIHMEQFPPVLVRAFGRRWVETGSLSCYFRNATLDGERVRALAQAPAPGDANAQINVWMERDDGLQVLEGTASIGEPSEPSLLRRKLAEPRDSGEIRILSELNAGQSLDAVPTRVDLAAEKLRLDALTEPMAWYTGNSPWGGPVLNPGLLVHAMVAIQARMPVRRAVGLYGAIEVRLLRGPVFAEHDYEVRGQILGVGVTPKTEYVWFESVMREPGGGEDIASMIMMLRFMKASSQLWAQ